MVMEFSDSVMDVDSHEINTSHLKQFSEVSFVLLLSSKITKKKSYYLHKLSLKEVACPLLFANSGDSLAHSITPS